MAKSTIQHDTNINSCSIWKKPASKFIPPSGRGTGRVDGVGDGPGRVEGDKEEDCCAVEDWPAASTEQIE